MSRILDLCLTTLILFASCSTSAAQGQDFSAPGPPYDDPDMMREYYNQETDPLNDFGWNVLVKFLILFFVGGLCLVLLYFYRSTRIVINWANANGFRIVSIKIPLNPGHLWGHTLLPEHQIIYYATIRTEHDVLKSAWVLCGNKWIGLLSDHVVVEWDEKPNRAWGIKMPFVSAR